MKDYRNSKTLITDYHELFNIEIDLYNYKYVQSCIDNYLDISNNIEGFCLLQDRFEESFKQIFEKDFNYFKINYN